ncbi:hypothetical protein U3516DRAFT_735772 [Neocallimastix sp. 'constans']
MESFLIVKHGMDINKMVYSNGKIPSFDVCRSGNKDLVENIEVEHDRVEYLVEHGADINKENKYNKISLFKAKSGNKDLVEYLVKHVSTTNNMNNHIKKRDIKSKEYDIRYTFKRIKTETNNL